MSAKNGEAEVHLPMIRKMERICRGYIDQLENGGKHFNIQNFMMMYIFGATNNTAYRTKLFDNWPTVNNQNLLYHIKHTWIWVGIPGGPLNRGF